MTCVTVWRDSRYTIDIFSTGYLAGNKRNCCGWQPPEGPVQPMETVADEVRSGGCLAIS
jgi:hypothetical protein